MYSKGPCVWAAPRAPLKRHREAHTHRFPRADGWPSRRPPRSARSHHSPRVPQFDFHMLFHGGFVMINAIWMRAFCLLIDDVTFSFAADTILDIHRISFATVGSVWAIITLGGTFRQTMVAFHGRPHDVFLQQHEQFVATFGEASTAGKLVVDSFNTAGAALRRGSVKLRKRVVLQRGGALLTTITRGQHQQYV